MAIPLLNKNRPALGTPNPCFEPAHSCDSGTGFFAALRNRYVALLMYLWFALFRPQDWMWVDITSLRLSMVFGIVLLVPALAAGLFPNASHPLSIGMILFLCSSIVSQMGAVRPDIGWLWIDFLFRLFLACLLLVTLTSNAKRVIGVFAVIGGSLGFHAPSGLASSSRRHALRRRPRGAFVDTTVCARTVMIMPCCSRRRELRRLVPAAARSAWDGAGSTWRAARHVRVIGTYSRGDFSRCAALLVFMALRAPRDGVRGLAVVVALVVTVVPLPRSYTDRLQTIQTYKEVGEDSALSRPHFWQVGINMGLSNAFGVGLRQYEAAYDQYDFLHGRFGSKRAVHSAHVQVFAEQGILAPWYGPGGSRGGAACLRAGRDRQRAPEAGDRKLLFTSAMRAHVVAASSSAAPFSRWR